MSDVIVKTEVKQKADIDVEFSPTKSVSAEVKVEIPCVSHGAIDKKIEQINKEIELLKTTKQDTLSFNGVYDKEKNKAATEETVNNAAKELSTEISSAKSTAQEALSAASGANQSITNVVKDLNLLNGTVEELETVTKEIPLTYATKEEISENLAKGEYPEVKTEALSVGKSKIIQHEDTAKDITVKLPTEGGTLATEEAKVTVNVLTDLGYNASVGRVFIITWHKWNTNPQRMSYEHVFYAEYDLQVTVNTGYQVGICYCTNSTPSSAHLDTGWITKYPYTIPKGSWFIVNIRREDNADLTDSDIGNVFIQYTSTAMGREQKLAEIRLGIQEPIEYGYSGEIIDFKRRGYHIKELLSVHDTSTINQGMAIHNNTIFRMLSNPKNTIEVRDFPSCENVKYLRNIQIGHASSCCFSNEYHTDTDEFPLLYVADCYEPKIYVVRIANKNWATTLKTIYLGTVEEIGYYTSISIDFVNKKLYVFGHTNNNVYSAENPKFYTVWDLSNLTENADGTFTPTLIGEKKYISFPNSITVVQDAKFFDGKIVLLTSTDSYKDTAIYFIEPSSGEITSTMANFDGNLKAWELEGMEFALNEGGARYDIILSPIYRGFYKLEFI